MATGASAWTGRSRTASVTQADVRSLSCVPADRRFGMTINLENEKKVQIGKSTLGDVMSGTDIGACSAEYNKVEKTYYVYIMSSQRRVLYIGITSHIERRVRQHKSYTFGGFTSKYNVTNLVYFERYGSLGKAIRHEKELKDWRR